MIELLFFILGILFIQIIIPINQSLIDWFCFWIELKKSNIGLKINQNDMEINKTTNATNPIGFNVKFDSDENYEEDE